MNHYLRLVVLLLITWLLLSGMYVPLMLSFGAVSIAISVWISARMFKVDNERYTFYIDLSFLRFLIKLAVKIVQSNIDVSLRILGIRPVQSTFVKIPIGLKSDPGRVIYANSITLTPGSSTIEMSEDSLLVHTISTQGAEDLSNNDMLDIIPSGFTRTDEQEEQA